MATRPPPLQLKLPPARQVRAATAAPIPTATPVATTAPAIATPSAAEDTATPALPPTEAPVIPEVDEALAAYVAEHAAGRGPYSSATRCNSSVSRHIQD